MFIVAIASLAGSTQDEAVALAGDLGSTAFETRLLLARELPAVVLRTSDKDRAVDLLQRLEGRGHQAIAFDAARAVPRTAMIRPRALTFQPDGIHGESGSLAYGDIHVVLLGSQPQRTETVSKSVKKKLDLGMAIATGGLKTKKKVKTEQRSVVEDREQMLILFPRTSSTPWLLEETTLQYQGLGDDLSPSRLENFRRVLQRIRDAAPGAVFDDRLARFAKSGQTDKLGVQAIDEQAYLIALCASRGWLDAATHKR